MNIRVPLGPLDGDDEVDQSGGKKRGRESVGGAGGKSGEEGEGGEAKTENEEGYAVIFATKDAADLQIPGSLGPVG